MSYYTLVELLNWTPQFGDHGRKVVQAELEASIDRGRSRKFFKIVRTATDRQADIDEAIAELQDSDQTRLDLLMDNWRTIMAKK